MFVSKWMTPNVITVDKNDSPGSALRLMCENRIRRLPVVSGGRLVGIVTEGDVFRALTGVTGVGQKTTRISPVIPDEPGSIQEFADRVRE